MDKPIRHRIRIRVQVIFGVTWFSHSEWHARSLTKLCAMLKQDGVL